MTQRAAAARFAAVIVFVAAVTLVWTMSASRPESGWTFYTPYSGVIAAPEGEDPDQTWLILRWSWVLLCVGAGITAPGWRLKRVGRSIAAAVCVVGAWAIGTFLDPARGLASITPAPRRYHYYYMAADTASHLMWIRMAVAFVPAILLAASFLIGLAPSSDDLTPDSQP